MMLPFFLSSPHPWLAFLPISGLLVACGLLVQKLRQVQQTAHQQGSDLQHLRRELSHRVNTNLAVVIGLMELQLAQVTDTPARQPLQVSLARIRSVALMQQRLYQGNAPTAVNLRHYMHSLYRNLTLCEATELILQLDTDELHADMAVPLGLILHELVADATLHASPLMPALTVSLTNHSHNSLLLEVTDKGPALEEQGTRWSRAGVALPQRLIEGLSEQIGGACSMHPAQGLHFRLHITR